MSSALKQAREARRLAERAGLHCPVCRDKRFVVDAGEVRARAMRCPACSGACAECGGTLTVFREDAVGQVVAERCPCAALDGRIALFNAAGVPRRYHGVTVESLEELSTSQRDVKMQFLRLFRDFEPGRRGVGLAGPVGCGKTHLLCAVVRQLALEQGVACRFVEFTHLLGDIRAGYDAGRGEHEILSHLVDVPVLVIDELGKGLTTEWQLAILDTLVSRRYDRAVTTFFATNYPFVARGKGAITRSRENFEVTTLEDRIGSRMMSRLAEMCALVPLEGPDFRRRPAGG